MTRAPGTKDSVVAVTRWTPEVGGDFIGAMGRRGSGAGAPAPERSDRHQDGGL